MRVTALWMIAATWGCLVRRYSVAGAKLLLSGTWRHQGDELTFTAHRKRAK